jgi:hypothetical protein
MGEQAGSPREADLERERDQLARDILSLADTAGMPDTYWRTDQRLKRARAALGLDEDVVRSPSHYETETRDA